MAWRCLFRAHDDVGGQEAAVAERAQRLPLPVREVLDDRGRHRGRQSRDYVSTPHVPPAAIIVDLHHIPLVGGTNRDDTRTQGHAASDRTGQRLGELVRAAVENTITSIVARHRPVDPGGAPLVTPEPERPVQRDLDRGARVHDLAPTVKETMRVRGYL